MRDGGYPEGAIFDKSAPYNQEYNEPIEVEVVLCMTISVKKKILVDDYDVETWRDEDDGSPQVSYNIENCDLYGQAMQQIKLPTDTEEFKDWTIDDIFIQDEKTI